jgi:hypothetical protein
MATIRPEITGRRTRRAVPCETPEKETEEKIAEEDDTAVYVVRAFRTVGLAI